jgi:serine/threonine protein kinase
MGEVYRARDSRLDREVAIKVLPETLAQDPAALKRLEREAKTIAALSHKNILAIFEFDKEQDISFVVTELLQGETLRARMNRSIFAVKEALEIAVGIAQGLSAAHSKGVVHRDLKPENIFLTSEGGIKILDFGLARLKPVFTQNEITEAPTKSFETETGTLMGTLPYMSPEQLRGEVADSRSDIFAFGCVLYEMLSGKRAFNGKTPADTVSAILNEDPIAVTDFKETDRELKALIKNCLEKGKDRRLQSSHDIAITLQELLKHSETSESASLETNSERVLAAGRMHAVKWFLAAMLVLLALFFVMNFRTLQKRLGIGGAPKSIQSLAVLPLENLSDDPKQEFFSDGMTDELITELSKIGALKVISRTSVMQYKHTQKPLPQIARELEVDGIIEGSVLRSNNRVRVSVQLIDAATDQHLWANSYERDLGDVLSLQSELAQAISRNIEAAVTPEEKQRLAAARKVDPGAYEALLKGRYYLKMLTQDSIQKGLQNVDLSISKQPDWAVPYATQAMVYCVSAFMGTIDPRKALQMAEIAARKAIELDGTLSDAHVAYGWVKLWKDWDWPAAEQEFLRAIELNPNSADAYWGYSGSLTVMKRLDEALAATKRAQQLDPLSPFINWGTGMQLYFSRRYDEAIQQTKHLLDLEPNYAAAYDVLNAAYWEKGMYPEALSAWIQYYRLLGMDEVADVLEAGRRKANFQSAYRNAAELMTRLLYGQKLRVALAFAQSRDTDQAMTWLEKAYEDHEPDVIYLSVDPFWDPLRSNSRFQNVVQRIGLP